MQEQVRTKFIYYLIGEINTNHLILNQIGSQSETGVYCMLVQYGKPKLFYYLIDEKENEAENEKDGEYEDPKEYDEIMPLCLQVVASPLLVPNDQELTREMNGVEKFSSQTIIYTQKGSFFLNAPEYCESDFNYWNLGWLDAKNSYFYEVNTLNKDIILFNKYFDNWLDFLQKILDDKIYEKLFEYFRFDKYGLLTDGDRVMVPEIFEKILNEMAICGIGDEDTQADNQEENQSGIEHFLTEAMKIYGGNVSFNLFKKKLVSNIKNFKDEMDFAASAPISHHNFDK